MTRYIRSIRVTTVGWAAFLLLATIGVGSLDAADTFWTGDVDSNFFNAANWTDGVPSTFDDLAIIEGGENLPVQIPGATGTVNLGAVQLGRDALGGSIEQNGGVLVIEGDTLVEETAIGMLAAQDSSWVMTNDATILYDDPLGGEGNGLNTDGTGKDFDIGKSVPEGAVGRLEMRGNSLLRISDDLKIADGGGGHGVVWMEANAKATIGSGISVSGVSQLTVGGNALLVTGNSADPGDSQNGRTNEGYLTLSTGVEEEATVEVLENGRLYARSLQQRGGISQVTVRNNGQFHVFDVFENDAPNLGQASVSGSSQGPQRTSNVAEQGSSEMTFRLFDNASMSFDTDLDDSNWSGLALSGGNNRGTANTEGGYTLIEVNDQASFVVQQDLHMTMGTLDSAESILSVHGPNATVMIGGDLRMALSDFDDLNPGTATLEAVISAEMHATITVGGSALIENGSLNVALDGYTPTGGENYQLLTAGQVVGEQFRSTSLPTLPNGLTWNLIIGNTSIDLKVSLPGDFNGNGMLDAGDIDELSTQAADGMDPLEYDLNGDSMVNVDDVNVWVKELFDSWIGDANLDHEFNSTDLVQVLSSGTYEADVAAVWSTGDFNADGRTNSSDLVVALTDGGYELGPPAAVAAVPEPSTGVLVWVVVALLSAGARRQIVAGTLRVPCNR